MTFHDRLREALVLGPYHSEVRRYLDECPHPNEKEWAGTMDALLATPPVAALVAHATALEAVHDWIETSHADFPMEHDHHCHAGRWASRPHRSGLLINAGPDKGKPLTESYQEETGKPCTCGWTAAESALAALADGGEGTT